MKTTFLSILLAAGISSSVIGQQRPTHPKTTPKHPTAQVKKPVKTQPVSNDKIHFFKGTMNDFTFAARDSFKPSFVYLYSGGGTKTETFEKLLADTAIAHLVNKKFLAYRMKADDHPDEVLQYGIQDLPAIILYDRNVMEISRLEGIHSAKEIIDFLKSAYQ